MDSVGISSRGAPSLVPAPGDAGKRVPEIDLLDVLRTIWRSKWLILFVTLCTAAVAGVYIWRIAVPFYAATTVVTLQNLERKSVDLESAVSGIGSDQASINTEVEVLRSRGLIDKLVDRLDLDKDPEFNVYLQPDNQVSLTTDPAPAAGADGQKPGPRARMIRDEIVERVLDAITISNIRQSYVFNITAWTHEPEKSALIADTLAELYIRDQLDMKFAATERATEWLTDRTSVLKAELNEAENAALEFNSRIALISPERLRLLNRRLKDFRQRHAGLIEKQEALERNVAELVAAKQSGNVTRLAEVTGLPAPAQPGEVPASASHSPEAFELRFEQILERARYEAERGEAQIRAMTNSIADLEREVTDQSAQARELEQLMREAEASRMIYEYVLGRLKDTSVQQGMQKAEARVLSYAMLPLAPSAPRAPLLLAVAVLIGLLVGSLVAVLLEMRSTAFRTAEEVQDETGTIVIGQIPLAPSSRRSRIVDYIVSNPTSAMVEAVRNLRTSILLSTVDRTPKLIMMTSSMPGEGKTTLSLALAQNLAGMGKKVLVIEGDMRRRTFREFFEVGDRRGLLTAVLQDTPLDEIVHREPKLSFDILLGERANINAADFFASERFTSFLDRVRDAYDFIVVDTPPVLLVPDALVIAQSADVVAYVVQWDKTPRRQVADGLRAFATVNAPVTGLVLSQVDPRGMKRYGHGGSYGQGYRAHSKKYYDS